MEFTVITSFNTAGMSVYGQTMIDSFDRFWPANIKLWVYAENCQPHTHSARIQVIDLLEASADLVAFKQRHRNNAVANGLVAKDTGVPFQDNAFKWDAVRFSHKVFAVLHACEHSNSDWVIWLDADTKTFAAVPDQFLESICRSDALACYLGRREKYHSECGWVAYNRRHPQLREFMRAWHELYVSDSLFDLREFHDSFVFDHLRKIWQTQHQTYFHNLTPMTTAKGPGHPFIASALGQYMDHMKGARRKTLGHSLPQDVRDNQPSDSGTGYWQQIAQITGQ